MTNPSNFRTRIAEIALDLAHKGSMFQRGKTLNADMFSEEVEAIILAVEELIGEDETETWFNRDLIEKGNEYERRFMLEEVPKRAKNKLKAELRQALRSENE